jgi:post-segregation antitoxin (ccd killing protein)
MAKTSIYLPDDLAEQVRAHGIPVSEVAQAALRKAVREAELKENLVTDIQAVAERMRGLQRAADEEAQAETERVHSLGVKWAREEASAEALQYVAEWDRARYSGIFRPMATMTFGSGYPDSPRDPMWDYFQAGAREVWEVVKPLLADLDLEGMRHEPSKVNVVEVVVPASGPPHIGK